MITDLENTYPALHVLVDSDSPIEITGTFPVRDATGRALDRFQVRLTTASDHPVGLPEVRETGGRVPRTADRHVNSDGSACVMLPEERFRLWPVGAPLSEFLDGPVRNYFLGQLAREQGDPWPFGEWSHGMLGLYEFVRVELGGGSRSQICGFVARVLDARVDGNAPCPCQCGKLLRTCCRAKVNHLRAIMSRSRATKLFTWLANTPMPEELIALAGRSRPVRSSGQRLASLLSSAALPN